MKNISDILLEKFRQSDQAGELQKLLQKSAVVHAKGLAGSLKALMLAFIFQATAKQVIFLASHSLDAEEIKEDLQRLLGVENVSFFPDSSGRRRGIDLSKGAAKEVRLSTLEALAQNVEQLVVAHTSCLLEKFPRREQFLREQVSFEVGEERNFDSSVARLVDLGFAHESRVEQPGEICVRGGIVDLFPYSSETPYRLEFWGNQIESIRTFDPLTQRSTSQVKKVTVFPQDLELMMIATEGQNESLLNYFRDDAIIVLDEPDIIKKEITDWEATLPNKSNGKQNSESTWSFIEKTLRQFKQIHTVSIGSRYEHLIDFQSKPQAAFNGNLKLLKESLERFNGEKLSNNPDPPTILFLGDSEAQAGRLKSIFSEEEVLVENMTVAALGLHRGFVYPGGNLVVFTDHQFYGRSKRLKALKRTTPGLTPKQLKQLAIGDFVVHVDFGIGRFLGLKKITVQGHERECLHLEYKDKDKVYVRVERMDRVNKYSSKDSAQPALSKLGSPEWQRIKANTKRKIKDIAKELIEIYAKRKAQNGYAFDEDSLWQQELEASFPFEDTPDQFTATVEVKQDMQSLRPMDRLVCGDVGFGKTEVAVRAAFKAAENGKQVAMLVPTTILAYQHFNTFKDRLEKFPVRVEMLSRFKTSAEQKEIVQKLKEGTIDIIIGTHRLLSKDVEFANLGLLIIDEEQRFGVTHKEKMKKMRVTIDVLTLTATPIPRTLQFSLMGARDMTNINTPPKNRLPIVTEILSFNRSYIREVILRELERGGQVFFVHNRVRSIHKIQEMLQRLIPEARIACAHGQLHERELERIMIDFMNRRFDILVATMIIESGLDMPNVNTIIIDHADKLGLAQLYQLRGRVGRSHQRAYAYLLIPPIETLTHDALKRLNAIEEFSEIGSGGSLAMRDLEIRGAGNLLGAEQTGFIDALGFDLYNKILDEAVKELKVEHDAVESGQPEFETRVEIEFDAYLPEEYVNASPERIDIYKRLTSAESLKSIDDIREELHDRFGKLHEAVDNLLNFVAIRILAKRLSLNYICVNNEEMIGKFIPELLNLKGEHFKSWLGSILEHASEPFEFIQEKRLGLRLALHGDKKQHLQTVVTFLQSLTAADDPEDNSEPIVTKQEEDSF